MDAVVDELSETWMKNKTCEQRIDKYWLSVFDLKRYPLIEKLVKPCLNLTMQQKREAFLSMRQL